MTLEHAQPLGSAGVSDGDVTDGLAEGPPRTSWSPPKTSRFEGFRGVMASAVGEVLRCAVSPVFSTWMSV
ncbi:hypothetical protein [Methylobacterium fujisawaense]